jgi:hypothetical protein
VATRTGPGDPRLGVPQGRSGAGERLEQRFQFGQAAALSIGDGGAKPRVDSVLCVASLVHDSSLVTASRVDHEGLEITKACFVLFVVIEPFVMVRRRRDLVARMDLRSSPSP